MDIVLMMALVLFAMLLVSWLVLPHTKELSESSLEVVKLVEEKQFAKAV
jgi:hypothetical protein